MRFDASEPLPSVRKRNKSGVRAPSLSIWQLSRTLISDAEWRQARSRKGQLFARPAILQQGVLVHY